MTNQNLLKVRGNIKAKKPDFQVHNVNDHPQFRGKWRRPRGIHNKMKKCIRGNRYMPAVGYGSPKDVRGLSSGGLMTLLISNLNDLGKYNEECTAVISSGVGMKKRLGILQYALSKKIKISGVKDVESEINNIKTSFEQRKKSRTLKEKKQEEKKKESAAEKKDSKNDKAETKNLKIKDGKLQEVKGENEPQK